MNNIEDPTATLTRLLKRYVRVLKADGSIANICASQEWVNQELMKNYDGQVTVGFERNEEQKLSLDGNLRRRSGSMRVNVWTTDRSEDRISGRTMLAKICNEVSRVIKEKRNNPNTVAYDFVGLGQQSETAKAYHIDANTEPAPSDLSWLEFTDADCQKIWYSDDEHFSKSVPEAGKNALMLLRFKIDADSQVLRKLVFKFEGYGTAPIGNGVTLKTWSFKASEWQNPVYGTAPNDETLVIALESDLPNYVDTNGFAYMLAKTTGSANGSVPAVLFCDFAETVFDVNGISHADIVSSRNVNDIRVKPTLWRTEFLVNTWLFEKIVAT